MQKNISNQGGFFFSKIVKQTGPFYLLEAILYKKTCQYHGFKYKPDYISLRKQENCIKRQKKRENAKKYHQSRRIFFQK